MIFNELGTQAILAKARNLQHELPPSEKAAAVVLLDKPQDIVTMSIDSFAQNAKVSKSSVLRFCESLGFKSYKDFKLALALELGKEPPIPAAAVTKKDTPKTILRKVIQADMRALEETLELIDEANLNAAVDALHHAKKIEIYGIGLSASIAEDAFSRFLRIGMHVSVLTDSHMQALSACMLSKNDVVFAISHSGKSQETRRAAKIAQDAGATVICLSSFLASPLVELADIPLVAATGETAFREDAVASRIAHLSVIDTLYVALANRRQQSRKLLERSNKVLTELTTP